MKTLEEVLTLYFRAWNDPRHTEARLTESCAPTLHYVDPLHVCHGVGELAARILRSHTEFPSPRVRITSAIDGYGDTFRYTWEVEVPDLELRLPGWDVVVRDGEGRLASVTSFFGRLEALEEGMPLRVQPRFGT